MSFLLVVAIAISAFTERGLCDKVLVFQQDSQPTNESRAVLYLTPELLPEASALSREVPHYIHDLEENQDPNLSDHDVIYQSISETESISDISVCLWLKVFHFRETSSYVFSYATSDKDNNELNFGMKYFNALIAVGGKYVYGKRDMIFYPDTWYHFCFVANRENKTGTFYLNGEVHSVERLSRRQILLNGSLVLGQETDRVEGGYQAQQSFSGAITGFNLYSRSLNGAEVYKLFKCFSEAEEGDLVAWSTAEWETLGPVDVLDVPQEEYCVADNFKFVVHSKKVTMKESRSLCRRLKSQVALPRNAEENRLLYNAAEPFADQCQPHNHATAFFWLGAVQPNKGNWTDDQGKSLAYNNLGGVSSSLECSGYKIPKFREEWYPVSCGSLYKFCVACQELEPMYLRMRGLCDVPYHSTMFRLVDQYGEMPMFKGFTRYSIAYDKNGTWSFYDVYTGTTLATYFTHNDDIPFGVKEWRTTTNFGICQKLSNSSHHLSLSACFDWEYTCGDGNCINLSQRCDLRVDCPDFTDETNCEKLSKPADYLVSLPPPGLKLNNPLNVDVNVSIMGFSEIDIRNMKLVIDFSMVMSWSESRVQYKNLRELADLNYIESKSVWIPRVELLNADFPDIHTTDAVLTILRTSGPEKDDPTRITRDEMYEGAKNPLRLAQKFNAPFSCVMNMKNFPFDTQHCQLLIRLSSAKKHFLEWDNLFANYLGEVMLAEYTVGDITIEKKLDDDYSLLVVGITFYRRYGYYLTSAYIPTIMLMMISYASLFCKRDNCDLRVMMALTTLLVLYALYQQISNDLPRTSYTKSIDVWCFFALLFIFTQVIFHVMVNVKIEPRSCCSKLCCFSSKVEEFELKENAAMVNSAYAGNPNNPENTKNSEIPCILEDDGHAGYRESRCHALLFARIFYLVLFTAFCATYWTIVLRDY